MNDTPIATALNEAKMRRVAAEIPIGTSRDAAYGVLRRHGLEAYNEGYATYKTSGPFWNQTVDVGYWPRGFGSPPPPGIHELPGRSAHPYVNVEYFISAGLPCRNIRFQTFYFDERDRVSRMVSYPIQRGDCL